MNRRQQREQREHSLFFSVFSVSSCSKHDSNLLFKHSTHKRPGETCLERINRSSFPPFQFLVSVPAVFRPLSPYPISGREIFTKFRNCSRNIFFLTTIVLESKVDV